MKSLLLSLALVALPALGDDGALSIRLYTHFQQAPTDAVRDSIQDEVARIMSPMGLTFRWTSLADNKGNELSVKLAVLHFTGHCDLAHPAAPHPRSSALGWTYVEDGVILPFSDIDCDGIRNFLQGELLAKPKEEQEESFGRAIGRVLTHELYHIFVNTTRHGSNGVAKPYYSVQELLSKDFHFEQKESQELRQYWSDLVTTGGF
jgi:hypothetical protein